MSFALKHEKFEGPLELLLDLIEKRKLFINDISLAKVADDYVSYVKSVGDFPLVGIGAICAYRFDASSYQIQIAFAESGTFTRKKREISRTSNGGSLSTKFIVSKPPHSQEFSARKFFSLEQKRKIEPVFSPDASMTFQIFSKVCEPYSPTCRRKNFAESRRRQSHFVWKK